MFSIILSMSIFAFIGAASPGPVNIIATSSSVNFGFKRTIPHVLGASIAYGLIVFIVGAGLSQLLILYPQLTQLLKYIGAIFLLYMAFKIATAGAADNQSEENSLAPSALQGGLSQGLNPKAWLVSMSGISIFVTPNDPNILYLILFTGLSFIICVIGVSIWAAAGQCISMWLTKDKYQIMFNRIMGLLLSLTVVTMFH
jgi:threonine/homoserine/homoserine lactone efflux protein